MNSLKTIRSTSAHKYDGKRHTCRTSESPLLDHTASLTYLSYLFRPYVERLTAQMDNYFCFGWDHLLRKLFDDWAWIEPRLALTQSYYLHPRTDLYRPAFSKNSPNIVSPMPSKVRTFGWKTHRCWMFDDRNRFCGIQLQNLFPEPGFCSTEAKPDFMLRAIPTGSSAASKTEKLQSSYKAQQQDLQKFCSVKRSDSKTSNLGARVVEPFGFLPDFFKRPEIVDWAPLLLSTFERAGGLSTTVPHMEASLKSLKMKAAGTPLSSLIELRNEVELSKEMNSIWDLNMRLKFLNQCGELVFRGEMAQL